MAATRIGITANIAKPDARRVLTQLCADLRKSDLEFVVERNSARLFEETPATEGPDLRELAQSVDLLVVLGGDGTILRVVGQTVGIEVPIMGINIGTLGFLTCATQEDIDQVGGWIKNDSFKLSNRSMLQATVTPEGEEPEIFFGLNEVSVCRANVSRMIHLETHVNGEYLNHYSADGLIVSTPTGSTAYSLSAGGPIIDPESGVFVITPICPHAMSNRSVVLRHDAVVEILAVEPPDQVVVTLDGRSEKRVPAHSRIVIRRAQEQVQLAFLPDQSFFRTLRHKLHWHGSNVS